MTQPKQPDPKDICERKFMDDLYRTLGAQPTQNKKK